VVETGRGVADAFEDRRQDEVTAGEQRLRAVQASPPVDFGRHAGACGHPSGALEHVCLDEAGPHLKVDLAGLERFLLGLCCAIQPGSHAEGAVKLEIVKEIG
jgi:hypothetical protein